MEFDTFELVLLCDANDVTITIIILKTFLVVKSLMKKHSKSIVKIKKTLINQNVFARHFISGYTARQEKTNKAEKHKTVYKSYKIKALKTTNSHRQTTSVCTKQV